MNKNAAVIDRRYSLVGIGAELDSGQKMNLQKGGMGVMSAG
jgi:hypothetical protein